MGIEAIIFDMDDLMINSNPVHIEMLESVFQEQDSSIAFYEGTNKLSKEEEIAFFGLSIPEVIAKLRRKYGIKASVNDLNDSYNRILLRDFGELVKPMPGLYELIDSLKKANYRLVVASSAPHSKIKIVLEALKLSDDFEAVVSGEDDIKHGKPNPDIFLKAAEKIGVKPEKCLVLEDANNGVVAAKAAGMYCIGVHNRFAYERLGLKQDLSKADFQINGLDEVSVDYIKSI